MQKLKERVSTLLTLVDPFIRGRSNVEDESEAWKIANELFSFVTSDAGSDLSVRCKDEDKASISNMAVKLHNKARALPERTHSALCCLMKPLSAWFLYLFHERTFKAFSTEIKLLSNGARDLSRLICSTDSKNLACLNRFPQAHNALNCSEKACVIYHEMNPKAMTEAMSVTNVEEMRVHVLESYKCSLDLVMFSEECYDIDEKDRFQRCRRYVHSANEVIVPFEIHEKVFFCEYLLSTVFRLITSNEAVGTESRKQMYFEESTRLLTVASNLLSVLKVPSVSIINSSGDNNLSNSGKDAVSHKPQQLKQKIYKLKMRVHMAMAYCFMETDQRNEALECVKYVELESEKSKVSSTNSSLQSNNTTSVSSEVESKAIQETIAYSKFRIFAKDHDWVEAEQHLRSYLRMTQSFETALSVVRTFVDGHHLSLKESCALFKTLAAKFPNDPELTSIRLSNLQTMVAHIDSDRDTYINAATSNDGKKNLTLSDAYCALDLANTIIQSHLQGSHKLDQNNYDVLRLILEERLAWYHTSKQWRAALDWADALYECIEGVARSLSTSATSIVVTTAATPSSLSASLSKDPHSKTTSLDVLVSTALLKANALTHLGKNEQSYDVAKQAFQMEHSTRTVVSVLCSSLLVDQSVRECIDQFLSMASALVAEQNSTVHSKMADLDRTLLAVRACRECEDISDTRKSEVTASLLKVWQRNYVTSRAWRHLHASASKENTANILEATSQPVEDTLEIDTSLCKYLAVSAELLKNMADSSIDGASDSIDKQEHKSVVDAADVSSMVLDTEDVQGHMNAATTAAASETADINGSNVTMSEAPSSPVVTESPVVVQKRSGKKRAKANDSASTTVGVEVKATRRRLLRRQLMDTTTDTAAMQTEDRADWVKQDLHDTEVDSLDEEEEDALAYHDATSSPEAAEHEKYEEEQNMDVIDASTETSSALLPVQTDSSESHTNHQDASSVLQQAAPQHLEISHFHLKCSTSVLREEMFKTMRSVGKVLDVVTQESIPLSILGSSEELVWIADLSWNVANVLCRGDILSSLRTTASTADTSFTPSNRAIDESQYGGDVANSTFDRFILAADFFELSQKLYNYAHVMENAEGSMSLNDYVSNQYKSLLIASACRIDADTYLKNQHQISLMKGSTSSTSDKENTANGGVAGHDQFPSTSTDATRLAPQSIENVNAAWLDVVIADRMLSNEVGFGNENTLHMRKISILLQFTILCRTSRQRGFRYSIDNSTKQPPSTHPDIVSIDTNTAVKEPILEAFVREKERDFMILNALELRRCAEIAYNEAGGTVEVSRRMLELSWQMCNREACPDYTLMGDLFYRLIELSPSRKDALIKIEEFEQLLRAHSTDTSVTENDTEDAKTSAVAAGGSSEAMDESGEHVLPLVPPTEAITTTTSGNIECPFNKESIDQITAMTYNFGVTLSELGQPEFAEKFIAKAMSLLAYASLDFSRTWKRRIEDTYLNILSLQSSAKKGDDSSAKGKATVGAVFQWF